MPSNLFFAIGPSLVFAVVIAAALLDVGDTRDGSHMLGVVLCAMAAGGMLLVAPYLLFLARSAAVCFFARRWQARFRACVSREERGEWCAGEAFLGWDKVRNLVQIDVDGFTVTAFDQYRVDQWKGRYTDIDGQMAKWPWWQTRVVVAGCEIPDELVLQRIGRLKVVSRAAQKFVYFERTEWLCFPWNIRRFMLKSVGLAKKMQEELAQLKSGSVSASNP